MEKTKTEQRSFSEVCQAFKDNGTVVRLSCSNGDVLDGSINYVGADFLQMDDRTIPFSGVAYIAPE